MCLVYRWSSPTLVTDTVHSHDDYIWLQLLEFISFLLFYSNFSILLRFNKQQSQFAQENSKLKDAGSCSKMMSSCNCTIAVTSLFSVFKFSTVHCSWRGVAVEPTYYIICFTTEHAKTARAKSIFTACKFPPPPHTKGFLSSSFTKVILFSSPVIMGDLALK